MSEAKKLLTIDGGGINRVHGHDGGGCPGSEGANAAPPHGGADGCELPHHVRAGGVRRGRVCGRAPAARANACVYAVRSDAARRPFP